MKEFASQNLTLQFDERSFLTSAVVCGEEILKAASPLVTLLRGGRAFEPVSAVFSDSEASLTMSDGSAVTLSIHAEPLAVVVRAERVPGDADALLFGPVRTHLDETIGDVIGVVQGRRAAFGMMALNPKTLEGAPDSYAEAILAMDDYKACETNISTGGMAPHARAASALAGGGSVLHFFCKNRTREEFGTVVGAPQAWIQPMSASDPDAHIEGASVMLFGCPQTDALETIGALELAFGLPHPMIDGEWAKTARSAMKSYLICDFSADEVDLLLDKAQLAGMDTLYHFGPFKTWGHFEWLDDLAESDADFKARISDKASARGMKIGLHTLTNFMTTNDAYVTPVPSAHLLKLARVRLLRAVDEKDDVVCVEKHVCFTVAQTLNAVQAGDEIFTFAEARDCGGHVELTGAVRGAFGTRAAAHKAGEILFPLRDYPYKTLFPDLELQDKFADRIVELFNATGAAQISFDGHEGCSYTGQDLYAPTRFLMRCFNGFDHFVLNDGSRLHHFGWHVNTRMNWGEPWGEAMRTGQVESRIRNQDFFRRNLFPRMLGWFLLRLADRKFECSSREDLEWALSEAAGFDAGYAMTIHPSVLRRHGRIDELLGLIREWDRLRFLNVFTPEQKERLRRPENEFRLEKLSESEYLLWDLSISQPYTCALSEMQPGQAGGSDWSVDNPQEPSFAFRLRVDGEGEIRNPLFKTDAGTIKFPCTVADGQYLLFDPDGRAQVTDRNYNRIRDVSPIGSAALPHGVSAVAFACEHDRDETPDVIIRFITRGHSETIRL